MADWRANLAEKIKQMFPERDIERVNSNSTKMAVALERTGKNVYPGTVPRAEIERRRAKNKRARAARRVNRQ